MRAITLLGLMVSCLSCNGTDEGSTALSGPAGWEGVYQSLRYRGLVSDAIKLANSVAAASTEYELCEGWENASNGCIPVHVVQSTAFDETDVSFVPADSRAIFLNADGIPYLKKQLVGDAAGVVPVDPSHPVAFVLLHELGHMENEDSRPFVAGGPLTRLDVETIEAHGRHPELMADRFAAGCIRRASSSSESRHAFAGSALAMSVQLFSWNISANRTNQSIGSLATGSREATWDRGYTHPNIELRFLITNHFILPTDASRELLSNFLLARQGSSSLNLIKPDGVNDAP